MITFKNIADLFIHSWSGGDQSKDSQIDERDVIKQARVFANSVLKPIHYEKWNEGDKTAIAQAIYSYELSLLTDDSEQKYLDVPEIYMALPFNKGLHRIYIKGNPFVDFVPMANPGISGNLPHTKLSNIQYYYVEGLKVKMGTNCVASRADKLVLQIINVAPDAISDTSPVPIMPEQVSEILKMLSAYYAPVAQVLQDYTNNQNTNVR